MSATALQAWMGVVAAIVTRIVAIFKYFDYKSKRDRISSVGASFANTVDALSSDNDVKRMAAAVLLRRFFDRSSEQSVRGKAPFHKEAVEVIAGMLREKQPQRLQKVLADGLRYAVDLRHADLTYCNLKNAFIGINDEDATEQKTLDKEQKALVVWLVTRAGKALWWRKKEDVQVIDLYKADLFKAICQGASFRNITAHRTVFYECNLERAVLAGADCTEADFRAANLRGADFRKAKVGGAAFAGAKIGGAKFAGAEGIPAEFEGLLDANWVGKPDSVVGETTVAR